MDPDWLQRKFTVEEAEKEFALLDKRLGDEPVPFGFCNRDWKELLLHMEPGDEIWEFRSPPETWRNLCGREGMCLVRQGEIVAAMLTAMS